MQCAQNPIDAYEESVHARLRSLNAYSGRQPGDPVRAAKAIIQAVDSAEPLLHLELGAPGLKMAREQLKSLQSEYDLWESVTLSADFPQDA